MSPRLPTLCLAISIALASVSQIRPETLQLAPFAGEPTGRGNVDGRGEDVRFDWLTGLATDSDGNIFVADIYTVRKISPDGLVTTLAGYYGVRGTQDGSRDIATFSNVRAVAPNAAGQVYVADGCGIRRIDPDGMVTTVAGNVEECGYEDATGLAARFDNPKGLVVDPDGNLYIADDLNHRIRVMSPDGVVTTLSRPGVPGRGGQVIDQPFAFGRPEGLTFDAAGNLYVADYGNDIVFKITTDDQMISLGRFNSLDPTGVAVDLAGYVYVSLTLPSVIKRISPDGTQVVTLAGMEHLDGWADGEAQDARLSSPRGLAMEPQGTLVVADTDNRVVRRIALDGTVTTVAGAPGGNRDGVGADARFYRPHGIDEDSSGTLYVADGMNHTIRKILPDGQVTTLAGKPNDPGSDDGVGTEARFSRPTDLAVDEPNGVIYVSDSGSTIRRMTFDGAVTTLAGTAGVRGSSDGIEAGAQFAGPVGLAVDGEGTIYVADQGNGTVRKVSSAGLVTTLAGSAGESGDLDGIGSAARFRTLNGITVDEMGNVYVTDSGNDNIRKITPHGSVTTIVARLGDSRLDGLASEASVVFPMAIEAGANGSIYFLDDWSVRRIDPEGWVSTLSEPYSDNHWFGRSGLALTESGQVYVADTARDFILAGVIEPETLSPKIDIRLVEGDVELSWLTQLQLRLETIPTLGAGGSWTAITEGIVTEADRAVLRQPAGDETRFFRLAE